VGGGSGNNQYSVQGGAKDAPLSDTGVMAVPWGLTGAKRGVPGSSGLDRFPTSIGAAELETALMLFPGTSPAPLCVLPGRGAEGPTPYIWCMCFMSASNRANDLSQSVRYRERALSIIKRHSLRHTRL